MQRYASFRISNQIAYHNGLSAFFHGIILAPPIGVGPRSVSRKIEQPSPANRKNLIAMHLTPKEIDKLMLLSLGSIAERRMKKGLKLNYPEAVAYITSTALEGADEKRRHGGCRRHDRTIAGRGRIHRRHATGEHPPTDQIALRSPHTFTIYGNDETTLCEQCFAADEPLSESTRIPARTTRRRRRRRAALRPHCL